MKLSNKYASAFGRDYERIPKAVLAALALSLATRLSEDNWNEALALLGSEWDIMHLSGLIPQKRPADTLTNRKGT